MALLIKVPSIDCPRCGEPLEVTTTRNTVLPGEVVVDFIVRPCRAWCALLDGRR